MQPLPSRFSAGRLKPGQRPMSRRFGVRLKAGEATASEGVQDITDQLVTTAQWIGNLTGMQARAGGPVELGSGAQ